MIQLLIAAAALSLIILIFRRNSHLAGNKPSVEWQHLNTTGESDQPHGDTEEANLHDLDYAEINRAYRMGDMHFTRSEFSDAEKYFIKVLAYNENHPEALNRLAVIYIQQEDPRRAELLFDKLFATQQKEPAYYSNYGRCLYALGRMEEAIGAYQKAIDLDPTKPSRFVSIGQLHYEMNAIEKSLEFFLQAVELDPYNPDYLEMVVELSEKVGNKEQQLKAVKKLYEMNPYSAAMKKRYETLRDELQE